MTILFALKQRNYLTTYASTIGILLARGHSVRLVWPDADASLPDEMPGHSRLSVEVWKPKRGDEWAPVASSLRRAADYLRYLEPDYRHAVKLRGRAFDKLMRSLSGGEQSVEREWSEVGLGLSDSVRERLRLAGQLIEQSIPSDPSIEALLTSSRRPDIVLVSPLIDLGSAQTDIVKSAARLGIPTGMVLFSWDNLSTKGGLHVAPDRLFVWNERQREEAASLHGYPRERAIVTGAPRFDQFFALVPSSSREAFCAPLGLDPQKPLLMYLGSSKFVVTDNELPFIRSWVSEVRGSSDRLLRECNILVRPHPDVKPGDEEGPIETIRWKGVPAKGMVTRPFADPRAVVLRSNYRKPQEFFDALHHSSAVVGLNTSAALEAAIVGRPAFTILAGDSAADGQASTLHFRYLLEEEGGCVTLAATFEEHRAQLAAALRGVDRTQALQAFARAFLRPHGLEVPASQCLADAVVREYGLT